MKAWDPWTTPEEFARKQVRAKPYFANPDPINPKNYESDQQLASFSGRTRKARGCPATRCARCSSTLSSVALVRWRWRRCRQARSSSATTAGPTSQPTLGHWCVHWTPSSSTRPFAARRTTAWPRASSTRLRRPHGPARRADGAGRSAGGLRAFQRVASALVAENAFAPGAQAAAGRRLRPSALLRIGAGLGVRRQYQADISCHSEYSIRSTSSIVTE